MSIPEHTAPSTLEDQQRKLADAWRENRRFRTLVLSEAIEAWAATADGSQVEIIGGDGQGPLPSHALPLALRLDQVHPEDLPGLQQVIEVAQRSGGAFSARLRGKRQDGQWRHLLVRGIPILDGLGQVEEWVGVVTDESARTEIEAKNIELTKCLRTALGTVVEELAERKRIEELLVSQNQILESIALGMPLENILTQIVQMVECRLSDAIGSVMLRDGQMLNIVAGPNLPKDYVDCLVNVPIAAGVGSCGTAAYFARPVIVADIANDELWRSFLDLTLPHGLRACWSVPIVSRSQWFAGNSVNSHVVGSFALYHRQISTPSAADLEVVSKAAYLAAIAIERELTQRALSESESRFRQFAAATDDVFWIVDVASGDPVYISPATVSVLGEPPEKYLKPDLWAEAVVDEDKPQFQRQQSLAEQGHSGEGRYRICRGDGRQRWVHNRWFPIRDNQGVVCRIAGTLKDVTEMLSAEEGLAKELSLLSDATRISSLGLMAAVISHEINQPLNAINNYANVCSRCLLNLNDQNRQLLQDCFEKLGDSAVQAGQIVRRLRSFVGKQAAPIAHYDLHQIVRDVLRMMGAELRGRQVRVELRFAQQPALVLGDALQLQQVFTNLLTNAAEAMAVQPVSSRVIRIDSIVGDKVVECRIGDSGTGIEPALLPHLFEPFLTTKRHGSGIGLSICKNIVKHHGGNIELCNCPDGGAVATIHLPLTDR